MITLRAGPAAATILPEAGAAFTRLAVGGRDILVPVPEGADPNRGLHGSFLMAPWTNRLDRGRIVVDGIEYRMPINRPDEDNALHGFTRELPWSVEQEAEDRTTLSCRFDRAPFRGAARMVARLSPDHLFLSVTLTNEADWPTPMGFGWHPYFPRARGTRLRAKAGTVFGRDPRSLPIAPRPSAGLAGDESAFVGLDAHFAGWDGAAEIAWPDDMRITLRADGAWSPNLHIYAPPHAPVVAVEPVSHAPDAANRAASAAHGAMRVLAPGESLAGSLMIHWR
jgi:aldose 1-epimerase